MNSLVRQFYRAKEIEDSAFSAVLFLADDWKEGEKLAQAIPHLPRGWIELCRLDLTDRIHFTCDFWLNQWTFHPGAYPMIQDFFQKLDDIQVVLSRKKGDSEWTAEMVYSLEGNRCFFRGLPPCSDEDLSEFKAGIGLALPRNYLSFLRVHHGFGKLSELGLLKIEEVKEAKRRLMDLLLSSHRLPTCQGRPIDIGALTPFYESFGISSYQCFFADWYPGSEMGNVYLSGIEYTISNYLSPLEWTDQLAFPTFLEWFAFYLEGNSFDREVSCT